jgi:hypothetical protein
LKPIPITEQKTWLPIEFHEAMIQSFAEDLVSMIAPDRDMPSTSDTKEQLAKLRKYGSALWVSLASLQGPALDALDFRQPMLGEFERLLGSLLEAASGAKVRNSETRKGPKPKLRAREIAEVAADRFYRLTGKAPTRITYATDKAKSREAEKAEVRGEFVDFLARIFKALDVIASADRYGKEAIQVWTKKRRSWLK